MNDFNFSPIGYIRSCFKEKFGTPRQPGLVPDAVAVLEIESPYQSSEAFRELESFSHIWLLFVFHQCLGTTWRPTVRPPRLGGNQRVGVFASRSGFRPNPIGQSAVELIDVDTASNRLALHLKGVDLVDGTPVLDIKPYLPYADSRPHARSGYAPQRPTARFKVCFTDKAEKTCATLARGKHAQLKQLIIDLLAMDPRPGYANETTNRLYGMRLWDFDIKFSLSGTHFVVEAIENVP